MRGWRRPGACLSIAVVVAGLPGCAQGVPVEPAPSASEPVCAELLLGLPDELVGEPRRSTTSQASRAWGDPAIVLRCGVDPLPPTTDPCLSIPDPAGENPVDWVASTEASDGERVFTTYGRIPAVEVTIPQAYPGDAVLAELAVAVSALPQDGECL